MPAEHGRRLAKLVPQGHLAEVDDSHTLIPLDQPARLAQILREFIRDGLRPSEPAAQARWRPSDTRHGPFGLGNPPGVPDGPGSVRRISGEDPAYREHLVPPGVLRSSRQAISSRLFLRM